MKKSLAELHQLHPYDQDERYWYGPVSLEDTIALAGNLHEQDDPISYLDDIRKEDYGKATAINRALLFLPPEVVAQELGVDVALWAAISAPIAGDSNALNEVLHDTYGYNIEDIEIANNWEWVNGRLRRSVRRILAQYSLMQAMRADAPGQVDLPAILSASARDGMELSRARLSDYQLIPIEADYNSYYQGGRVKGWDDDLERKLSYDSWLDSPSGFALTYKGVPNALVGLSIGNKDELMIEQLQGVRANRIDPLQSRYAKERVVGKVASRGLMPLDWQRVMVESAEQIAQNLAIPVVGIRAGKNNVWTTRILPREEAPHLTLEQAERAYDVPAARLGYKKASNAQDNWHKKVA